MANNGKEPKRIIVITGIRPTYHLYDELSKHYTVAVYNPDAAQRLAARQGSPVTCPIHGAGQPLYQKAQNEAALMAAQIARALPTSYSADGLKPVDVSDWAPGKALADLMPALVYTRTMDAYAESDGVDITGVVVHEDVMPTQRALALWAKARGVPLIHMPHANAFLRARPDIHDETLADWLLVQSSYMRDWHAERGFPKNRIRIVGFPSWDDWAKEQPDKAFARRVLHLDEEKTTITFCTGWSQRTNLVDDHDMIDAAVHLTLAAAKKRDWQIIWKLHPGDAQGREEQAARFAAAYRVPALVTRDHLGLTMAAADVVVSCGPSNVLVEAGLVDRPSALYELRGYEFDGEPPWKLALDADAVVETIESLLDGVEWRKARKQFVRRYAFKNDGKATARAVRQIRKIVDDAIRS